MKTFDEQFPELVDVRWWEDCSYIQRYCLSRQRVREAIEKLKIRLGEDLILMAEEMTKQQINILEELSCQRFFLSDKVLEAIIALCKEELLNR